MTIKKIIKYTLAGAALVAEAKNVNHNNKNNNNNHDNNKIQTTESNLTDLTCVQNSDCPNNAICSKLSSTCLCPHNFSGQSCQLSNPKINCTPEKISIQISKSWIEENSRRKDNNNKISADRLYLGFDPYNKNCQAAEDPENFYLEVTEDNPCGTKIEKVKNNSTDSDSNAYIYTNQVSTQIDSQHRQAISDQLIQSNILAELTEDNKGSVDQDQDQNQNSNGHSRKKRSLQSSLNDLDRLGLINWSCTYSKPNEIFSNNIENQEKQDKSSDSQKGKKLISTNLLNDSKQKISIKAFSDQSFQNCQTSTVYEGQKLFLQIFTPDKNQNNQKDLEFDIQSCSIRPYTVNQSNNDQIIEIFSKRKCMTKNNYSNNFSQTNLIKDQNGIVQFSYDLNGLPEEFMKIEDFQFYVDCQIVEEKIDDCDGDDTQIQKRHHQKKMELGVGPFLLKKSDNYLIQDSNLPSSETTNNSNNNTPNQEISKIISLLSKLNLESDDTQTKSELNTMLNNLKTASQLSTPVIKIDNIYQLEEFEVPGPIYKYLNEERGEVGDSDFIEINDFSDNYDLEQQRQRVRNLVILAISIGLLIICLISLPILYVYFKNSIFTMKHKEFENDFSDDADLEKSDPNQEITTMGHIVNRIISKMSNVTGRGQQNNNNNSNNNHGNNNPNQNNNDNGNDQSKKSKSQHQIVTMDTGLHVDHALHFVEYTDHIHDLVFEDTEGYNDTSMWIKQMSTDTQSIDISNQDPIKMTYNDSMYNKNGTSLGGSLSQHVLSNRRRYSSSNSSLNSSIINGTSTQKKEVNNNRSTSAVQQINNINNNNINNLKVNRGSSMTSFDRNGSVNIIHCSQDQHKIVVRTNSSASSIASSNQGSINSFQGGNNTKENRGFGGHNNSHSAIHKIQNRINSISQVRNSRNSSKINVEKIDLPNPSYVQTSGNKMVGVQEDGKPGRKKSFRLAGVKNTNLSIAIQ